MATASASFTSISLTKRTSPDGKEQLSPKEKKLDRLPFLELSITIIHHPYTVKKNCVFINPESVKVLWPEADGPKDTPTAKYVQIAKKVYRALIHRDLDKMSIGISEEQIKSMDSPDIDEDSHLTILRFNKAHIKAIRNITLSLIFDSPQESTEPITLIPLDLLRQSLIEASHHRVVDSKDHFILEVKNQRLRAKVMRLGYDAPSDVFNYFGKITSQTTIHFVSPPSYPLCITEEKIRNPKMQYVFDVSLTKPKNVERNGASVILEIEDLREALFKNYKNLEVVHGSFFRFSSQNGWVMELKLSATTDDAEKNIPFKPIGEWNEEVKESITYSKAYIINKASLLVFREASDVHLILTKKSKIPAKADKIQFEIISVRDLNDKSHKDKRNYIVDEMFLKKQLKLDYYSYDQKIEVASDNLAIVLRVSSVPINYAISMSRIYKGKYARKWTRDENTKLHFINKASDVYIIDRPDSYRLTSLKIELKAGTVEMDYKQLKAHILPLFKNGVVKKEQFEMVYVDENDKKIPISFKILDMQAENSSLPKFEYGFLGKIDEKTEISYVYDEDLINWNSKPNDDDNDNEIDLKSKDPLQHLIELGMGGLSEHFKKIILNVLLSRSHLKDEARKRGIRPVRGLLLYGPPGTGKTTLAKNMAKILGCPEKRVQMISAPSVFNKWMGNSEKNVREWFEPAREAYKKQGDKSPLFMVIVDEIDAILGNREAMEGHETRSSVVNQFLAEMDGLNQLDNILFIGMTNRLDHLDPAAVRSGRFGVAVEIGLPDGPGRRQIFDIYMKEVTEANLLQKDISMERYVNRTEGFTGADIKAFVERACSYSIQRLFELKLEKDQIQGHPAGEVTSADFELAFAEIEKELQQKPRRFV